MVQALPSVQADTTIQSIHLASPVAAAAALISTASRLESSLSNVTRSQNACEYQLTQVTVIQLYFPSALQAGSNANEVFSHRVIFPVIVPQSRGNLVSAYSLVNLLVGYLLVLVSSVAFSLLEASSLPHNAVNQANHPAGTASPSFNVLLLAQSR